MSEASGLVLRSGEAAGLVLPFKLPALALGSGAAADVQCTDLEAVHCLLMPTPAGPVLRSFSTDATLLNGIPVLAALLHHGDRLKVGSTEFDVCWPELVPLTASNETAELVTALTEELNRLQADYRVQIENLRTDHRSELDHHLVHHSLLMERACREYEAKSQECEVKVQECEAKARESELKSLETTEVLAQTQSLTASLNQMQLQLNAKTIDRELFEIEKAQMIADRDATTAARHELVQFSETLSAKQTQMEAFQTQLQGDRDALEHLKAEAAARIAVIGEEHRKATEVHERTRAAAAQYLRDQRTTLQQERSLLTNQRIELEAFGRHVQQKSETVEAESHRVAAEVAATNAKLQQAWGELNEGHQKFEAERIRLETEWTAKERILSIHEQDLAKRESALQPRVTAAENRLNELHAEIAGLEQRAMQARKTLADVEAKRDSVKPRMAITEAMEDWTAPVPLNPKHDHRNANDLMSGLRQQEAEMAKERQRLFIALRNIAAEREAMHDHELRLKDERQRLESAQMQWQAAEEQTVSELEHLAMTLSQRESRLMAMEKTWTAANQVNTRLGY